MSQEDLGAGEPVIDERNQETSKTLQAIVVALDCSLEFEGMTLAEDTTYFGQRT